MMELQMEKGIGALLCDQVALLYKLPNMKWKSMTRPSRSPRCLAPLPIHLTSVTSRCCLLVGAHQSDAYGRYDSATRDVVFSVK